VLFCKQKTCFKLPAFVATVGSQPASLAENFFIKA
jgi:hypothetical protein